LTTGDRLRGGDYHIRDKEENLITTPAFLIILIEKQEIDILNLEKKAIASFNF
jgi:hypothetical protein